MNRVFLDASFWIARRDEREQHHVIAERVLIQLVRERARFVTTPMVFAEVHAYFCRSLRIREAVIRDFWNNPLVDMELTRPEDHQVALGILTEHRDKDYSFCDAVSFALIGRLGLRRAASFDNHFKQFGTFETLG